MCHRINGKKRFLIPEALSWEKKSVLRNYVWGVRLEIVEYGFDMRTGQLDIADLRSKFDGNVTGIYAEVPNFFGVIDPQVLSLRDTFSETALVIGVNPLSLGVLRAPGDYSADIVVGEGQVLGSPMNFGGPLLGIFAARQEHVRKMPGRVIGMTRDAEGNRAFCMTLQTREQHIRRSKATSNICTSEALMSLAAAVHLSMVGKEGLRDLGRSNMSRARRLMDAIGEIGGYESPIFEAGHFNEFVIKPPIEPSRLNKHLLERGMIGGLPLDRHVSRLEGLQDAGPGRHGSLRG